MAPATLSATETALENQKIGALQIRVIAICTLIQMCDGYDINSIGWAVPSLIDQWHLPPHAFSTAFMWSSIGIMVGALASGPIGDRFGRRPLLLGSIAIFGVASLLSAAAGSLSMLSAMRFFTGVGIGGAFSGTVALTGDYTPQRLRATMIMISFTGAPLGSFVGGLLISAILVSANQGIVFVLPFLAHANGFPIIVSIVAPSQGWQIIFVLGGAFPLVLLLVMAVWLPESPRFLAQRAELAPHHRAVLDRLGVVHIPGAAQPIDIAASNPIAMLFGEGRALQTVLLWIVFFSSLMNLFLFAYWMPTVLHLIGLTKAGAVFASSLRDLGGIFAVFYLGYLIDRAGPERSLALHYAVGAVFIALIALVAMPYAVLLVVLFLAGMTIIGSQDGANAAAGMLYPARMRTTGIGWALGIGRLGGIAAPALGGFLLEIGVKPLHIFLSACIFAIIAAVATALLRFRGHRAERLAMGEVAP